ncbi:HupE/UreJ family protein [Lebetimonas sp. JH292]|uniref:HupE/UreJ family protein n=1 Tax=Lebetimonas sp. JH292 TaxID=990068 RepID=UPI000467245E|nr:HupE/UreJ family protein [Lebetimonas sp. JH292]
MIKKILILLFTVFLNAHPLNITKMTLDLNKTIPTLYMRFAIFNIQKALHKENISKKEIQSYILNHIKIDNCKINPLSTKIKNEVIVNNYFNLKCNNINKIYFDMFFDIDKTQQGIMKIIEKNLTKIIVFNPNKKRYILKNNQNEFLAFLKEGIFHILEGIDHIFFLLMLIIAVLLKNKPLKKSLIEIIEIATAFTISHSITLSLSMFNIVNPPENLTEVLIACTILFVALNNLYFWIKKEWLLAFLFGFIHGFGFANALKEMNVENINFIKVVFGESVSNSVSVKVKY